MFFDWGASASKERSSISLVCRVHAIFTFRCIRGKSPHEMHLYRQVLLRSAAVAAVVAAAAMTEEDD